MWNKKLSHQRKFDILAILLTLLVLGGVVIWFLWPIAVSYWEESASRRVAALTPSFSKTTEELIEEFSSTNSTTQIRAVEALAARGPSAVNPLIDALGNGDQHTRRYAAVTLGRIGPGARAGLPALCSSLGDDDKTLVDHTLFAIQQIVPQSQDELAAVAGALNHTDAGIRRRAMDVLVAAKIGAIPHLVAALQNEDREIRIRAAVAVAELDLSTEGLVPILLDGFKTQRPSQESVIAALKAVGAWGDRMFIEMLGDPEATSRQLAAHLLKDMKPASIEALPALIQSLKDPDVWVRILAAKAIQEYGSDARHAATALMELFSDSDWSVRVNAARALSIIDPENEQVVSLLINQLTEDENSNARREAAKTLGEMGEIAKRAVPHLRNAMQTENEAHVQLAAARAFWLLTRDTETTLQTLAPLVASHPGGSEALDAIKEFGAAATPLGPELIKAYRRIRFTTHRYEVGDYIKSLDPDLAKREGIP
jgi:HEAT repeat protein